MNNRRELSWCLRKDVDRDHCLFRVVARIRSLAGKTAETCQPLRTAQSPDILVKHLFRGRPLRIWKNINFVWIFHGSRVLDDQAWYLFRGPVAMVAGVARNGAYTLEIIFVDSVHHENHSSSGFFERGILRT